MTFGKRLVKRSMKYAVQMVVNRLEYWSLGKKQMGAASKGVHTWSVKEESDHIVEGVLLLRDSPSLWPGRPLAADACVPFQPLRSPTLEWWLL
jgi:hypothetical protein